jgi:PAS domain S-box-containing protein
MADENAKGRNSADIAAALADPAFASLARAGAPVIVAAADPLHVLFANDSALVLFAARDCAALTAALLRADAPGARRLAELACALPPGGAPRVERLSFPGAGGPGAMTALCRRTSGESPLFVFAGLGRRGASAPSRSAPVNAPSSPQGATVEQDAREAATDADSDVAAVRTRLEARFPGLAPARFLWRTDSNNVVVEVTPPLAEIVGQGCADLVGHDLVQAAQDLGLDPLGQLAEALRARNTFSRIDVDWPIEGAAAAAAVTLGGLPMFDRGARFEGWRGFGVIHMERLTAAPPREALLRVEAPPPSPFEKPAPPEGPIVEAPAAPPPSPPEFSGVVVPLRPMAHGRATPVAEAPETIAGDAESDDDAGLVLLSPHERSAFREIARALGARGPIEAGREAGEEPSAPQSETFATPDAEAAPARVDQSAFAASLPVGIVVTRDGSVVYANPLALQWLGHADLDAFRAAGGLRAASRFSVADLAAGQKRALLLRTAAGEAISVDAQNARIVWEGRPADMTTLIRPAVSALEQRIGVIEASLRQREAEIDEVQSMLDVAADGVVLVNADGAILGLDRAAETLLDYERNQVAGEAFTLLLARESQASALDYFTRAKTGVEKRGREAIGRTRRGATLPLHLTLGRLGKAVEGKYCLILRDMRQWRQTERSMDEARERAERDNQAKSEFLAKVSHEIRTPLNAILGFAEVIMDERFGPVGTERYKDYLRDIHTSGTHVLSLVNDLLDLSKIEAGKLELNVAAVDANRVVSECVSLIQPQANREKVITRLALATRLPAIQADERSLRQIVLNLLANAVRYNEPGGQVIVSTALAESGHAVLRIKDTGIGMSESELGSALEPFRQVAAGRGGTGLGLPLTKALAEANGARFAIKSRKNEGTLVEVIFPLAPGAADVVSAGSGTR